MLSDVAFLTVLLFAATGLGLAVVRILTRTPVPTTERPRHVLFAPLGLKRLRSRSRSLAATSGGSGSPARGGGGFEWKNNDQRRPSESFAEGVASTSSNLEGVVPVHPAPAPLADQLALAVPVGLGLISLGLLAMGEVGRLDTRHISIILVAAMIVGMRDLARVLKATQSVGDGIPTQSVGTSSPGGRAGLNGGRAIDFLIRSAFAVTVCGTFLTSLGPVADGDALCYHLQVPKVFLAQKGVGFEPDLHETVYPLVAEMLYAAGLSLQGPVACRLVQWTLGLLFAATVTAMARPVLGRRAFWAGAVALGVPAVSNGMGAPLNDVALAAFGNAAILAWLRWRDRPTLGGAVLAGMLAGFALGVKYPAIVLVGLLGLGMAATALLTRRGQKPRPFRDLAAFGSTALLIGGCWYLRAYLWTGNPVFPFFRHAFGGAGIDEVLDPIKRPMAVNAWNVLTALWPMTLDPNRFDSVSHQFGPVFLMLLPGLFLLRAPRRIWGIAALGYAFLTLCVTQRQSMRFVLIAIGPFSVAAAWVAVTCWERRSVAGRLVVVGLLAMLAGESLLAVARARHALPVLIGKESAESYLARKEPTSVVGRWMAAHLPESARVIGQDHRGFYLPRPYTMELAHRRRTGLASSGETPEQIVAELHSRGFTHVMMCPPIPEDTVEFDPTLGRALAPWLEARTPMYRADLPDGDGVVRRYAIYPLEGTETLAVKPEGRIRR